MQIRRVRSRLAWAAAAALLVVGVTACGSDDNAGTDGSGSPAAGSSDAAGSAGSSAGGQDGTSGTRSLRIAVVPKSVGAPYFVAAEKGAIKAAEDFGVTVDFTGPAVDDVEKQITIIEDLITQKVDALIIAPTDSDALIPVIKQAMDAGIPTFTFDTDAPDSARLFNITAGDAEESGAVIAESLAKSVDYQGEVALLTAGLGQDVLNRRLAAITSHLEQWPDITVVATEASDGDFQKCVSQVENLLQTYPDLKGIAGVSTENPPAAATAIQAAGKEGQVAVTGIGLPSQNLEFINGGVMNEVLLWDPGAMTYDAVKAAIDYIETGDLPTDGQDYGWGGTLLVDGSVGYVPSLTFTKENIGDYDF